VGPVLPPDSTLQVLVPAWVWPGSEDCSSGVLFSPLLLKAAHVGKRAALKPAHSCCVTRLLGCTVSPPWDERALPKLRVRAATFWREFPAHAAFDSRPHDIF